MFLSNTRLSLVVFILMMPLQFACGSKNAETNVAAGVETTKAGPPFATKEPDVYQADTFVTSGGIADRYFIARNGATRRFDTFVSDKLSVTELIKDNTRYVIDHVRKVYYADPPTGKGPTAVNAAALAVFQNTEHHEFEETGRSDGQITYHAKKQPGDRDQDVTVTIDPATGLMVRQEVKGADPAQSFTFELKNVKVEAADDLFQIPAGYKQVSKDEFKPPEIKRSHE